MKPTGANAVIASLLVLFGLAGACGGVATQRGGSETNWLAICSTDANCTAGHCLCGVCSATCDDAAGCPAGSGLDVCVVRSSPALGRLCVATRLPAAGVCLKGCGSGAACAAGFSCFDGACLPERSVSEGDGSAPTPASTKDPLGAFCVPGDEQTPNFSGYSETEINIASNGHPDCESGLCLMVNFRGRTNCPYGQPADPRDPSVADPAFQNCMTTGPDPVPVTVPVPAQLVGRPPEDAAYCSCRCDGPASEGPFCTCPSGLVCTGLLEIGTQVSGAYCLKPGTWVPDPASLQDGPQCDRNAIAPRPTGCGDP